MGNTSYPSIEFLGGAKCPKSPVMEKNLVAAFQINKTVSSYRYIDMASLPEDDYRRGYGTPSILINGEDLFGLRKPLPSSKAPS